MIDYIRIYRQFTSSHHFYEGIRMTAGVMVPVLVCSAYGHLPTGVSMALGALCVSLTDYPGPVHHRRNGMLNTILLLFFTIFITGVSVAYPWLVLLLLVVLPFLFSMMGVYGVRATSVGMACMLVMMLNIDQTQTLHQVLQNALLAAAGGGWYFLLSMALHQLRPYKLLQQVLGDCMQETAHYMRMKAAFYDVNVDFDKSYEALTKVQIEVHHKQETARELLFKTRSIVKESTHTGRVLVMAFTDMVDLFERIMTSQQEYRLLHQYFADTALLPAFQHSILQLASDLEELGIAFQEGRPFSPLKESSEELQSLEELFKKERTELLDKNNADAFISLRHILNSIKDLKGRIDILHSYSSFDLKLPKTGRSERDFKRFVIRSDFSPDLIIDNLNLNSNILRHAIRVSVALVAGYLLSWWLPLGHDYWILLTIIVILKPAYALTRERNFQRLAGTVAGAAIAALVLFTVKDTRVLVGIIMICMITAYSFMRVNYLLSVIFMTAYILVAFHFLKPGDVTVLLKDRIVDTSIGSAIAFLMILVLPPKWEHENIKSLCAEAVRANARYFVYVANAFTGEELVTQQYKLRRKEAYVGMANLSDAFQRMLNEPKSKQQKGEYLHQFIVSNHVLASHSATLSAYRHEYVPAYILPAFEEVILRIEEQLQAADNLLLDSAVINESPEKKNVDEPEDVMQLVLYQAQQAASGTELRLSIFKTITDQFDIILRVAGDIKEIGEKL